MFNSTGARMLYSFHHTLTLNYFESRFCVCFVCDNVHFGSSDVLNQTVLSQHDSFKPTNNYIPPPCW